jgi:hypothetical protein
VCFIFYLDKLFDQATLVDVVSELLSFGMEVAAPGMFRVAKPGGQRKEWKLRICHRRHRLCLAAVLLFFIFFQSIVSLTRHSRKGRPVNSVMPQLPLAERSHEGPVEALINAIRDVTVGVGGAESIAYSDADTWVKPF